MNILKLFSFFFKSRSLPATRSLFTSGYSIFSHIMKYILCTPELEMLLREALEPQLDLGGPILKNAIVFMKRKGKRGDKKQDKFLYDIKTDL